MESKTHFLLLALLFSASVAWAQSPSRSGFPAPSADGTALRQFPCAGTTVFEEFFDAPVLPAGWQVIDYDGGAPRLEIEPIIGPGWQVITDFKKSFNRALASPSWYEDSTVRSEDWLISPQITLPANGCLSWFAYSQDQFYPESYQVRISTTTPDTAGFFDNPALATIGSEGSGVNYRSVNLKAYAGQQVYIAFRHTSKNKFILVLDDIRIAQVNETDVAIHSVVVPTGNEGFNYRIRGAVGNFGSDTLRYTNSLKINYSINGGATKTYTVKDTLVILANDTVQFVHDSLWKPADPVAYLLKVWVDSLAGDINRANDTAWYWVGIGFATSVDPEDLSMAWSLYPNPATSVISIRPAQAGIRPGGAFVLSPEGKKWPVALYTRGDEWETLLPDLSPGLYLLEIHDERGGRTVLRFLKN